MNKSMKFLNLTLDSWHCFKGESVAHLYTFLEFFMFYLKQPCISEFGSRKVKAPSFLLFSMARLKGGV